MRAKLLTFGVWALVAGASLFWGLRLFVAGSPLPAQTQTPGRSLALGGDLHRVLGAAPVAAVDDEADAADDGAGRLRLLGVVAPRGAEHSPQGVALIAVGDQPARAWRTGSVVDKDLVLLGVSRRGAQLGPRGGPATTELTLPEPTPSRAAPGQILGATAGRVFGAGAGGVPVPVPGGGTRPMGMPQVQPAQGARAPAGQADAEDDEE